MNKQIIRCLGWMLSLVMLLAVLLVPSVGVSAAPADSLSVQEGVTLHCWNWSFAEIEAKLDTIAALGYTSIQTSPIQQAKQATKNHPCNDWWVYYQPAAFHIDNTGTSALGTKDEFKSLCDAAHKKGIKVIVDVVANHMGNTETGENGLHSSIIPELKDDASCWHDVTKNVTNYSSRHEVTQYCMAGLPDLNTASDKVQNLVLGFLKECIDAGADGFRFDAAKHIETPDDGNIASDFWPTVIDGAKNYAKSSRNFDLYCYGELLDSPGGNIGVGSYTKYMSVTDNTWSNGLLNNTVKGGNAASFSANYHKGNGSQLVLWAESHDTFADGSTYSLSETTINKAWALIAARSDAMGLYLARPANMSQYLGTASDTAWAFPEVAAVNQFHNKFAGQSEYVANENGIAYVERGTAGVVLVNCKGGSADISVSAHKMADGTYTDQISGNTFTVSGGKISGTIGSETGIAVVYEVASCAHAEHNTDGFCKSCKALVGHSYDEKNTCACGDVKVGSRTVYFLNTAKWKKVNFYSWYTPTDIISEAWPGTPMTHVEGNVYSCEIPLDAPNIIFNDGSTQTEDLTVPSLDSGRNIFDFTTKKWNEYEAAEKPTEPETTQPTTEPEPSEPASTEPSTTEGTQPSTSNQQSTPDKGNGPIIWVVFAIIAVVAIAVLVVWFVKNKKN